MSNQKKKLLVTASTFLRWQGDTEPRFILDLAKALTLYYDVTVLAPACPKAKTIEKIEGVKVIRYHYFPIHQWETLCYPGAIVPRIKEKKARALLVPFLFFGLWFKLLRILKKYDLVHAHWIIPQGIVQSVFKKPYIVIGHGGDVTSLNKGILRMLKIRALKHAKHVIVVSKALKQEVLKMDPCADIIVRSMGCNTDEFSPKYRVNNFFQQGDRKVVLFVGRLAEKKGVTYLIEAVKNLNVLLVIVGSGPLEKELKEQAMEQGDKIQFLGAKTHQELQSIFASADIFAVPSITAQNGDKEGTPTVLSEAMASGLPIVGSDSGGIAEVIQDGVNGFLTKEKSTNEIAEKIEILLQNPDLYRQMASNARKTGELYDYRNIAKCFADTSSDIV